MFPGICANGECIDTFESFLCQCRAGFALDDTERNCTGEFITVNHWPVVQERL